VKPKAELLMALHATPNEVIALNAIITHHLKYFQQLPYKETYHLLRQFQARLVEQLPTVQTPIPPGKR
jgi:hypothetical protein